MKKIHKQIIIIVLLITTFVLFGNLSDFHQKMHE